MSILDEFFSIFGSDEQSDFTPPTSLCPGDCPLGPGACQQCRPYKEKLKEALYNVDHLDAFLARYEVTGGQSAGATTCPHCGAPSENPFRCEYCGMQIREDDGKIRVASANDIPDPILEAQNIIFERHNAIVNTAQEGGGTGDFLSSLLDLFGGAVETGDSLGKRMTKEEITEAAASYGVSISTYLNGLDNGAYLTLDAKKRSVAAGYSGSGVMGAGLGLGLGGAALGSLLGGSNTSASRGGVSLDSLLGRQRSDFLYRRSNTGRTQYASRESQWGTRQVVQPDARRMPEQPRQTVQQPRQTAQQARREEPLRQPTQQARREEPLRQPTQQARREEPLRQPTQNRAASPLRQPSQPNRVGADPRADKQERRDQPKGGPSSAARKQASDRGNDKRDGKGKR